LGVRVLFFGGGEGERGGDLDLQPARVELERLFVLVGVDDGFCWAGGDGVEVSVWMGAHVDDRFLSIVFDVRRCLENGQIARFDEE